MGFGALTYAGKYQLFVNYVNEMAAMIKGYGMVPIAFNDGIYFNQDTSYNFDKQIAVLSGPPAGPATSPLLRPPWQVLVTR